MTDTGLSILDECGDSMPTEYPTTVELDTMDTSFDDLPAGVTSKVIEEVGPGGGNPLVAFTADSENSLRALDAWYKGECG